MRSTKSRFPIYVTALFGILILQPMIHAGEDAAKGGKEPKNAEIRLDGILRDIINRGADLYNGGDRGGCYRLFQGAILAVRPQLDLYPDIQKTIDSGLADAERQPTVGGRAFI